MTGSGELQESLRSGSDQRPRPQDLRADAGPAHRAGESQALGRGENSSISLLKYLSSFSKSTPTSN